MDIFFYHRQDLSHRIICFLVKRQIFYMVFFFFFYLRSKDSNESFTYKRMILLPQLYKWRELSGVVLLVLLACFHDKTCEQHFSCFQAGWHYSHFHQHSCSGNVPSGWLISGLILLRAPCFATDLRCCQTPGAHISGTIIGDCRMTLIKVIDV